MNAMYATAKFDLAKRVLRKRGYTYKGFSLPDTSEEAELDQGSYGELWGLPGVDRSFWLNTRTVDRLAHWLTRSDDDWGMMLN